MKKALIIITGLVVLGVTIKLIYNRWEKKRAAEFDASCRAEGYRVIKSGFTCIQD